jgi:hypothetical protein
MPTYKPIIVGDRFGRWTVLATDKPRHHLCRCACGTSRVVYDGSLKNGASPSCGCLTLERMTTHGHVVGGKASPTYSVWAAMIARCKNPNLKAFKNYGGRGITVCERWRLSYEAFLEDMGECPQGLSIERENNDGNYEPGNCRWATRAEQNRNRRGNRLITFRGETHSMIEWTEILPLGLDTLRGRLDKLGWSVERAFTTPKQEQKKRSRRPANTTGAVQ